MQYTPNRIQVLIASPDASVRKAIASTLSGEQFQVFQVVTGQQALRTIRDHLLDVVLLDYRTPFMRKDAPAENPRVLEGIIDASPFLPLVLVCDRPLELDHRTTMMADMIITHPLKASVLHDAVDTVLGESLRERAQRKAGGLSLVRLSI